jgi:hypothetical protein
MASEKAALEFQLEKSLRQFHEVQVPNLSSFFCFCLLFVTSFLQAFLCCDIILNAINVPSLARLKQKGVELHADQHLHGKKIPISRH